MSIYDRPHIKSPGKEQIYCGEELGPADTETPVQMSCTTCTWLYSIDPNNVPMPCIKCGKGMMKDYYESGRPNGYVWFCPNCGEGPVL